MEIALRLVPWSLPWGAATVLEGRPHESRQQHPRHQAGAARGVEPGLGLPAAGMPEGAACQGSVAMSLGLPPFIAYAPGFDRSVPVMQCSVAEARYVQACEGTDAVPPNARSHTVLLSGKFPGEEQALARLQFGLDAQRQVAMKVVVRAADVEVSNAVHSIIQDA